MAYFADLTPYTYFAAPRASAYGTVLNIGWLDGDQPYPIWPGSPDNAISRVIADRLDELRDKHRRVQTRGFHVCPFCLVVSGSAEIRVSHKGITYAAPELVAHYVGVHGYRPPDVFLDAVGNYDGWRDFDPANPSHSRTPGTIEPKRRPKYGNTRTFVLADLRICLADDGPLPPGALRFASKKEAERYVELALQQRDGTIANLTVQPRYTLHAINMSGTAIVLGDYRADFAYRRSGATVVEDVKSPASKTPLYEWKRKHLRAEHGIEIIEI